MRAYECVCIVPGIHAGVQTQNVSQGFEADGQGAHLLQTSLVLHTKCLGNPCVNLGTGVTSFGLKLGSHQTSHQT
jgi:hypothetical protein